MRWGNTSFNFEEGGPWIKKALSLYTNSLVGGGFKFLTQLSEQK